MKKFLILSLILLLASGLLMAQETESSETFARVDKIASFPGGNKKYVKYLKKNLRMPSSAKEGTNGRVYVHFIVGSDGVIDKESIRIVEKGEYDIDEQKVIEDEAFKGVAIDLVKGFPNWEPALSGKKPVRMRMIIPIVFQN